MVLQKLDIITGVKAGTNTSLNWVQLYKEYKSSNPSQGIRVIPSCLVSLAIPGNNTSRVKVGFSRKIWRIWTLFTEFHTCSAAPFHWQVKSCTPVHVDAARSSLGADWIIELCTLDTQFWFYFICIYLQFKHITCLLQERIKEDSRKTCTPVFIERRFY